VPGTINIAGSPGGVGASGASVNAAGGGGGGGVFYVVTGVAVPVGGSGAGGINAGKAGANGGGGATGGDGKDFGGGGGGATVYSFASENSMLTYVIQGLSDWWLINMLGLSLIHICSSSMALAAALEVVTGSVALLVAVEVVEEAEKSSSTVTTLSLAR
jgi:hypothetical protein